MGNWGKRKIDGNERLGSRRSPLTQALQYKLFFWKGKSAFRSCSWEKPDEGRVKLFKELCNWLEEENRRQFVYTGPVAWKACVLWENSG